MYVHTDGTKWRTGIRWFWGGEYHKEPPKRLRDGTRYQIFVPVEGNGPWRLHTLANGAKPTSDPAELRARFNVGGWAHMGPPFDAKEHGKDAGKWAGR